MQLVDTPPGAEREQTRRRPARRTRVAASESENQTAAPTPLTRSTRRARTTIGERAPEQTVSAEAATPIEAASEATPKRRRTRKTEAPTESVVTAAETTAAAEPVAPEAAEAAPRRRRTRKAVQAEAAATGVPTTPASAAPMIAPVAIETAAEAAPGVTPAPKRRTRKMTPAEAAADPIVAPAVEAVASPEISAAEVVVPAAAPKRRTRKKTETTVEPEHATAIDSTPASSAASASAATELAAPEATPRRRRTRKADAVAASDAAQVAPSLAEAAPVAAEPATAPGAASKPRRTRKAVAAEAATAAPDAPVETPAAAPAPVEPTPDSDWAAEFVPTITRVRIGRRGERKVTSEKVLEPGELRRRRRERRERLAAQMSTGTPSPLAAPTEYVQAFGGLTLSSQTAQALAEMNYQTPTEIQAKAIPLLLEGKDVVGQAQTGTGKTAAFGIPLVERIDPTMLVVQALVLAPTRELASQISQELGKIGRRRGLQVAAIYGGASMGAQLSALKRGAQVVVGTPGRILDHLKRGTLSFESVSYLVLDEADRMLDMGFMPDVERILRRTPRNRQTALFSATVPTVVRIISRRHMRDAVTVQVQPEQQTVSAIDQIFYEVAERDKPEALETVLREQQPERAMIFCRTQIAVDRLTRILRRDGFAVEAIHGSLGQGQRERVIADFRRGAVSLLIATNLAARGLDIPEVSHVINYDIPEESESYVHRIGRTARMGREGVAITFVAEWDQKSLAEIKKVANGALREERLSLYA